MERFSTDAADTENDPAKESIFDEKVIVVVEDGFYSDVMHFFCSTGVCVWACLSILDLSSTLERTGMYIELNSRYELFTGVFLSIFSVVSTDGWAVHRNWKLTLL